MANLNNIIVSEDFDSIKLFLDEKSETLRDYIELNSSSSFTLIRKSLSYADIISKAKRKDKKDSFDLDKLMYLTTAEMEEIFEDDSDKFGISKQSNITVPPIFYEKLGIKQLERRSGAQKERHNHILINDYANVYLVNESYKYFDPTYTKEVLEKLGKECSWNFDELRLDLDKGVFTEIELRHAIHGIGTANDKAFHNLRHSLFRADNIYFLIENNFNEKNLFIFLEKNTKFFSILGLANRPWLDYLDRKNSKLYNYLKNNPNELTDGQDEKTRNNQSKWRNMLAEEVMNYTKNDRDVFCAFTRVQANYDELGTLYRASHIKRYENCNSEEAFDLNNGILLSANADALFDKFLITISEDKEFIFSFLLEKDYLLKDSLGLNSKSLFKLLLNEERMKYMKWHREEFFKKESERKIK